MSRLYPANETNCICTRPLAAHERTGYVAATLMSARTFFIQINRYNTMLYVI